MNTQVQPQIAPERNLPFERVALVLALSRQKALRPVRSLGNPKALVAYHQAVAELRLEGVAPAFGMHGPLRQHAN